MNYILVRNGYITYMMKIHTEFILVAWPRIVKFTDLHVDINKLYRKSLKQLQKSNGEKDYSLENSRFLPVPYINKHDFTSHRKKAQANITMYVWVHTLRYFITVMANSLKLNRLIINLSVIFYWYFEIIETKKSEFDYILFQTCLLSARVVEYILCVFSLKLLIYTSHTNTCK